MPYDKITDPKDLRVVVPLRVPWRMREELHKLANKRHISLNTLIVESIEAATGVGVKA